MDLTNCKKTLAIVYASVTGNTEELVNEIHRLFLNYSIDVRLYKISEFPVSELSEFDAVIVGTYTWGDGDIPKEAVPLYNAFEIQQVRHLVTGVVGTGDRFYPHFCGAVDEFRDMLYVHSKLAATLKVELAPLEKDFLRCEKFVQSILKRLGMEEV